MIIMWNDINNEMIIMCVCDNINNDINKCEILMCMILLLMCNDNVCEIILLIIINEINIMWNILILLLILMKWNYKYD